MWPFARRKSRRTRAFARLIGARFDAAITNVENARHGGDVDALMGGQRQHINEPVKGNCQGDRLSSEQRCRSRPVIGRRVERLVGCFS